MIPGSANSLLLTSAAGAAQYQIERSLRFNSADSASLTQASYAGSGTFSAWVKRCKLGAAQTIISGVSFNALDQLNSSTAVFRDPSAWMHVVVSSLGTYVNNTSVASGSAIAPSAIGSGCDLYLADIHFIDGQALDPTSFGYTDSNGIWQPKAYTGTYGTNGFHLDFADNSAASTAGIGKDVSGNGNDWTPNNLSVAAGAGNDSLVDTPTNYGTDTGVGGEVRGNYCTLNPLRNATTHVLSEGNLSITGGGTQAYGTTAGTIGMSSGKWYWEQTLTALVAQDIQLGIGNSDTALANYIGATSRSYGFSSNNSKWNSGSSTVYTTGWVNGDIIGLAFDADAGSLTLYKNGVSLGVAFSSIPADTYFPMAAAYYNSSQSELNFGQRPFAYTAPNGYKALCTQNLSSTTITTSGSYTGNGLADGPFVYLNGVPTAMTVNGNSVTFGTEADKLSNGFKVRTASTTYNQNAATYNYSITSTGDPFKVARAQSNP